MGRYEGWCDDPRAWPPSLLLIDWASRTAVEGWGSLPAASRTCARNHPPLAAGAQYVEDRVQHEPVSIHPRPTTFAQVTNREQRLDHQPHLIGESGGIASRGVIPLGLQVHTPVNATSPCGPVKRSSDFVALKSSHQI